MSTLSSMDFSKKNPVVNRDQIIQLCARALRLYDERLVDHGERVAHIACSIREKLTNKERLALKPLMILSIFHDIGAFKTEEIDRMLEFESNDVEDHSVYGYLFLKHFTPLSDASQAILYHHTPVDAMPDFAWAEYASLIYLADRLDVALANGIDKTECLALMNVAGRFRPEHLEALSQVLSEGRMYAELLNGQFQQELWHKASAMDIGHEEAVAYLRMLVYSIDFKSPSTVFHSVNTTKISLFLGEKIGLDKTSIQKLYYAALIHDLGKIAIPTKILELPGKLSSEQMTIMQQHVVYTKDLVEDLLPEAICRIAARHHEKLDGSGYPLGLSANDLSTEDRIVAIADICSALISKRSYKKPFSREKTLTILSDMAKKKLVDTSLVSLLADNFEELELLLTEAQKPIAALYQKIQEEFSLLTGRTTIPTH